MSAPKFAPMHAGLLARKGEAAPSAEPRPPLLAPVAQLQHEPAPSPAVASAPLEAGPDLSCAGEGRRIAAPERPVRAGVRLDPEQSRRLRLAAAILGSSQQELISEALDRHLDRLAEGALQSCACFRRR